MMTMTPMMMTMTTKMMMILTQPPEKLAMAVVTNAFMHRCHLAVMMIIITIMMIIITNMMIMIIFSNMFTIMLILIISINIIMIKILLFATDSKSAARVKSKPAPPSASKITVMMTIIFTMMMTMMTNKMMMTMMMVVKIMMTHQSMKRPMIAFVGLPMGGEESESHLR